MRSKWLKNLFQGAVLLGVPTWVSVWGISFIPFEKLPLSHFWTAMIYRAVNVGFCLLMIWVLKPSLFKRFTLRIEPKKLGIMAGLLLILVGRQAMSAPFSKFSIFDIVTAFFFTMSIGVDEEIFSRVMIFGFFQRYGVWVAAVISSIHFGALHIGNYFWGDQSWDYTVVQVVGAGAFGFLCCGFMLYGGSVWVPILLHGLSDFPFQFMTQKEFVATGHAQTDWVGAAIEVFVFVTVGAFLIYNSQAKLKTLLVSAGAYV